MPAIEHMVVLADLAATDRQSLAAAVAPGHLDGGPEAMARADVVVLDRDPDASLAGLTQLRWVHIGHAGIDGADLVPFLDAGIAVTTAAGRSAEALAEHALGLLLALNGQYARFLRAQRWRVWGVPGQGQRRALHGRTALVVGTGHTGRAVAKLCAAVGMRVLGHRRRDEPESDGLFERVTSVERGESVDLLLPEADAVILAAALNDGTRHLIAGPQLAAMRPGALLVNVARGGLVDEGALVAALRRGHLGGAATDVVDGEPLAVASPLWRAPNLLITPHSSPRLADRDERAAAMLLANVDRWVNDEPLENQVGRVDLYSGPPSRRPVDHGAYWRRVVRRFV